MKLSNWQMPFGKYKGREIGNIPAGYLLWCYENLEKVPHQLRDYVDQNKSRLEKEAQDEREIRNRDSYGK